MTVPRLTLSREQIIAFRLHASALDQRLPMSPDSIRQAAWAGLQDSMPRAALLSIHARVLDTPRDVLDNPALIQVWGPRYSAYAVAAVDMPIFTLGRLPDDEAGKRRAERAADALRKLLADERMKYGDAGRALSVVPNSLRYGTTTGTIAIRWDGARQPHIWMVPPPTISAREARLELARHYLHVFAPATADSFAEWAGIATRAGMAAFDALRDELTAVETPVGDAWILASDESDVRLVASVQDATAPALLLPSGDTFFLLWGKNRQLLVPDADRRSALWTSRVWPGALVVGGEVVGVWRRANEKLTIEPWHRLGAAQREAVEAEAVSLPLPGLQKSISVNWAG